MLNHSTISPDANAWFTAQAGCQVCTCNVRNRMQSDWKCEWWARLLIEGDARGIPRWQTVEFIGLDSLDIRRDDLSHLRYAVSPRADTSLIEFVGGDSASNSFLAYDLSAPWQVSLQGSVDGRTIRATLLRADSTKYRLVTRGFHWVNEYPYNK